jgi:hypothetical protein
MARQKYFSYCVGCAVIITALASLLYESGGEYLLLPGMAVELYLINPVVITVSSGSFYLPIPIGNRFTFNVALYALAFYAVVLLVARARNHRSESFA